MKELIFVRHAKSDWGHEGLMDIDRPLNQRGYEDAYSTAQWFVKNHSKPQQIVSSPATRALSTALIFARNVGIAEDLIKIVPEIYEAPASTIMAALRNCGDQYNTVMVFGHNPGFTDMCNELNSGIYFDNVPTCGLVSIQFKIGHWKELRADAGTVQYHFFPKEFRNK